MGKHLQPECEYCYLLSFTFTPNVYTVVDIVDDLEVMAYHHMIELSFELQDANKQKVHPSIIRETVLLKETNESLTFKEGLALIDNKQTRKQIVKTVTRIKKQYADFDFKP